MNNIHCGFNNLTLLENMDHNINPGGELVFNSTLLDKYGFDPTLFPVTKKNIEQFVLDVIQNRVSQLVRKNWRNGFRYESNNASICHIKMLPSYILLARGLSDKFNYNQMLSLFKDAVSIVYEDYRKGGVSQDDLDNEIINCTSSEFAYFLFNRLIKVCMQLYKENGYAQRLADEKSNSDKLLQSSCRYIDRLFDAHGRIIVIRLDLFCKNETTGDATIQQALTGFEQMLANTRHNRIFKGMIGYAAKFEYGLLRGPHWHVLFFLMAR